MRCRRRRRARTQRCGDGAARIYITKYTRTNELANKHTHSPSSPHGLHIEGLCNVIYLPKFDIIMSTWWVGPYRIGTRCVATATPWGTSAKFTIFNGEPTFMSLKIISLSFTNILYDKNIYNKSYSDKGVVIRDPDKGASFRLVYLFKDTSKIGYNRTIKEEHGYIHRCFWVFTL